jgi:hypothetical protein
MASQTRSSQIRDLVNQWEQLVGYSIEVPDWAVDEMSKHADKYASLYDVGQYMVAHQRTGGGASADLFVPEWNSMMPWGKYGMNSAEYGARHESFDSSYRKLTGQNVPQDVIDRALKENQGAMTGAQFDTWLLNQDSIKQQYGWLKYGIDFQQFQTQKLQMEQQFGGKVSDQQAILQLQYLHAAQGADKSAAVTPTLTQIEKKQANVGAGQSEVR